MSEYAIYSPPYPKNADSPRQLFTRLCELHEWVFEQKEWTNLMGRDLSAPEDPFIPEIFDRVMIPAEEQFTYTAVTDMYVSWQALRAIREKHDDIVRNYETEEEWSSPACVFHRINLVKIASLLLTTAFLDREKREAKEAEFVSKMRKKIKKDLHKMLNDAKRSLDDVSSEDDNNEDIDFDVLFNPPQEDEE